MYDTTRSASCARGPSQPEAAGSRRVGGRASPGSAACGRAQRYGALARARTAARRAAQGVACSRRRHQACAAGSPPPTRRTSGPRCTRAPAPPAGQTRPPGSPPRHPARRPGRRGRSLSVTLSADVSATCETSIRFPVSTRRLISPRRVTCLLTSPESFLNCGYSSTNFCMSDTDAIVFDDCVFACAHARGSRPIQGPVHRRGPRAWKDSRSRLTLSARSP